MTIHKDSIKCLPNPTEATVIEYIPLFCCQRLSPEWDTTHYHEQQREHTELFTEDSHLGFHHKSGIVPSIYIPLVYLHFEKTIT